MHPVISLEVCALHCTGQKMGASRDELREMNQMVGIVRTITEGFIQVRFQWLE